MKGSLKIWILVLGVLASIQVIWIQNAAGATGGRGAGQIRKVDFNSLTMSDPFILADPVTKTYYMTGSGGAVWKSSDLKTWEGLTRLPNPTPIRGWAPGLRFGRLRYIITKESIIVLQPLQTETLSLIKFPTGTMFSEGLHIF